jgi:hypothetical protein
MSKRKVQVCQSVDVSFPHATLEAVNYLRREGYVVIRTTLDTGDARSALAQEIQNFQEYSPGATDRHPLGGFSAYGNPSSFHNPTVRSLRLRAYEYVAPLLRKYAPEMKMHAIIDRLLVRPTGRTPTGESWHRDEAPAAHDTDVIFGGWWNLNNEDSYLSCVPRTHIEARGHAGFAKLSKEERALYTHSKALVRIPPGAILIFNEKLVHEVCAKRNKHTVYRLFLGWRLTHSTTPLMSNLDELLTKQGVAPLKSAQIPPMFAKLHWVNWKNKLMEYSKNFSPQCLEKKDGGVYVVHRHMKSLQDYGFSLYAPYEQHEINILKPH